MNSLFLKYIFVFVGLLLFSLIVNWIMLKFVKTLGIRNRSETIIRYNENVKPSIGGLGFFIIFLIAIALQPILLDNSENLYNYKFLGILIASSMGFLMGLFDDAFDTKPYVKLFTQIACGIVLISTGTYIHIFEYEPFNYALTVLWVIGMMNSINMLDNMDGITTIVSIFIILTILVTLFIGNNFENSGVILLIGILAALIGFLFFNFNPSKMFMGDTGSQFLGIFLASMGILYFWNAKETEGTSIISKQILVTITAFLLPVIDTTTVFIKRIKRGSSPFVGGKDHTTHHLSYLGLTDRQVAYIFVLLSSISMGLVLLAFHYFSWNVYTEILYSAYIIITFLVLFIIANKNKDKN